MKSKPRRVELFVLLKEKLRINKNENNSDETSLSFVSCCFAFLSAHRRENFTNYGRNGASKHDGIKN